MRVQGFKEKDGWAVYDFLTTYRMGWMQSISFAAAIGKFLKNPEILVAHTMGEPAQKQEINDINDIWTLEEGAVLEIRGMNMVYDHAPFCFFFFNQTDVVQMSVPVPYVESLKKSESEFLTKEEQVKTFDKFMDSIEINGAVSLETKELTKELTAALTQITDISQKLVYKGHGAEVDLTDTCEKIIRNYKAHYIL